MGYHLTTADDVETRCSQPPTPVAKYTVCHRKPLRGPIFIWVLSTKYTDWDGTAVLRLSVLLPVPRPRCHL